MIAHAQFQLRSIGKLHWACYSEEYVVFDESSGQTHQLDVLHAFLLQTISEKKQDQQALCEMVSAASFVNGGNDVTNVVQSICNELVFCGLVEEIEM